MRERSQGHIQAPPDGKKHRPPRRPGTIRSPSRWTPGANKVEIRQAVEKVLQASAFWTFRTINMNGKRKSARPLRRPPPSDWKKAIVTIAPGDHIDFFEGV